MMNNDKLLFSLQLAGQIVNVTARYETTKSYCGGYLTRKNGPWDVTVTDRDLAAERERAGREDVAEGRSIRSLTDAQLEITALQRKIAETMFDHDILVFHGSAVAVDGAAYLFTAHCGTGKSTHTRLWRQVFGDRAVMVNDDKPFLKITEGAVFACGAPWSGKHGLDTNITVPLKGICILCRGNENRIRPVSAQEASEMLRKQSVPPQEPEKHPIFLSLVDKLSKNVSLWQMDCTKDPEAAIVSHAAMSGQERGAICTETV
jgi:hypothetical protein